MNKKLIGLFAAAAMTVSAFTAAFAETAPKVFVDDREIVFEDQSPVIMNDFTMVPLRGVFEALGADVRWDGELRQVRIESADHLYRVFVTIDSSVMKVYKILGLGIGGEIPLDSNEVTLEAPAVIMNDKTMVPLRAVSESIGCDAEWIAESETVKITSKDYKLWEEDKGEEGKLSRPGAALVSETKEAAKGDTFDIYMTVSGLNKITKDNIAAVTSTVIYDPKKFEVTECVTVMPDGTKAEGFSDMFNAQFTEDSVKFIGLNALSKIPVKDDVQKIAKFTFKSLTGEEGSFVLSTRVDPTVGNDVGIITINPETYDMVNYENTKQLVIDTAAVTVKAK